MRGPACALRRERLFATWQARLPLPLGPLQLQGALQHHQHPQPQEEYLVQKQEVLRAAQWPRERGPEGPFAPRSRRDGGRARR